MIVNFSKVNKTDPPTPSVDISEVSCHVRTLILSFETSRVTFYLVFVFSFQLNGNFSHFHGVLKGFHCSAVSCRHGRALLLPFYPVQSSSHSRHKGQCCPLLACPFNTALILILILAGGPVPPGVWLNQLRKKRSRNNLIKIN